MKKNLIKFLLLISIFAFAILISKSALAITANDIGITASDVGMLLNFDVITQAQANILYNQINSASVQTTATTTDSSKCANLTSDLKYTESDTTQNNNTVSILQNFLSRKGYLKVTATGYFGKLTLSAVKAFQSDNGISPTGEVETLTRTAIQNLDCNYTYTTGAQQSTPTAIVNFPIANKMDSVAPTVTLEVNPSQVAIGQQAIIKWNSSNAINQCKITFKDSLGNSYDAMIGLSGTQFTEPISEVTTYTIICYNKYGIPGSKSATVKLTTSNTLSMANQQIYNQLPKIISVNPSSANRGGSVIIQGSYLLFSNSVSIYFDGKKIDDSLILSKSSSSISFIIPSFDSCLSANCLPPINDTKVETGGQKMILVSNTNGFSNSKAITLPSKIVTIPGTSQNISKFALNSIDPKSGNRGDKITIYGSGFTSDSIVLFGGFSVPRNFILSRSNTSITFTIPPSQIGCTEPDYEICPRLPVVGQGTIIETGGNKSVYVMNMSTKATTTSAIFTLPSKKITY